LSVPWSPIIFLSGPPPRPWPAYQTGTRFLSPVAFMCFRTGAKRCYKKALTSNGSSRIDNQGLLGKPGFRHWASENFGSVVARSKQGVAGRGFFSFRRWLDPRSARPDTDPSWPQVCYALGLIRVAERRPIHRLVSSVTQPPAVSRLTIPYVPEQDELTGVLGHTAPPRSSERANFFLANYTPYGPNGVVPCIFGAICSRYRKQC
jgi:hypothetical protein